MVSCLASRPLGRPRCPRTLLLLLLVCRERHPLRSLATLVALEPAAISYWYNEESNKLVS